MTRRRLIYAAFAVVVILLGLASRKFPGLLFPSIFGKYPGDALWASLVFLIWGFCRPELSVGRRAVYALLTAYADEFSQIYQAPWINAIRATTVGHMILGSTFSWWDELAYTVGIALGSGLEKLGGLGARTHS